MGFWEDRANLTGKVAVVVGGGGGLGRACALDLGRAGCRLALCDRNEQWLSETEATLTAEGVDVLTAVLDAREEQQLTDFFAAVDERYGQLDVLVNVVGGTFWGPFMESNAKGWNALIRTNFTWLLHSTQLAIPRMKAAGGGSIINLTSADAHRGVASVAVYSGLKAAVTNFGRSLALEVGPDHIRVNTIAPVDVATEGMAGIGSGGAGARNPLGRRGTYEDVGSCALFLASDLSSFITGASLHPSGGVLIFTSPE
jgi:NAD(P)-dependent dehydrogenase (short-subunit alcohol dehydrogenase family)